MDLAPFALAVLSLLATPGPTNTLLATAGASVGPRRAARLLAGELGGYLVSVLTVRFVLGPTVASTPAVATALGAAVAVYLVHLAIVLWRHGAAGAGAGPVTIGRVFVTTLLNPKALVFALVLLPQSGGWRELLPWIGMMAVEIVAIGGAWVVAGASVGHGLGSRLRPGIGYRVSAAVLALLAGLIGGHSLAMI